MIGRFEIINPPLGKGAFGDVFLVKDPTTGYLYAAKSMDSNDMKNVLKEIEVLLNRKLVSPRLVQYYSHFSEESKTHVIMEYCEKGSLDKWIQTQPNIIPENEILKILAHMVDGLNVLHENNIIHGDVKLQNTLVNNKNEFKISDFGSTKKVTDTIRTGSGGSSSTIHGTFGFIPADVILGAPISKSTDMFALGCTLYYLMVRRLPFEAPNGLAMVPVILAGKYAPIGGSAYSNELKSLVYSMLQKDPSKRPTLAQLKKHSLIQSLIRALPSSSSAPPPPSLFGPTLQPIASPIFTSASVSASSGSLFFNSSDSFSFSLGGRSSGGGCGSGGGDGNGNSSSGRNNNIKTSLSIERSRSTSALLCRSGCGSTAEDTSIVCTNRHPCCSACLQKAAKAVARVNGTRVMCVDEQCNGSYPRDVLEDQLPRKLLTQLLSSPSVSSEPSALSTSASVSGQRTLLQPTVAAASGGAAAPARKAPVPPTAVEVRTNRLHSLMGQCKTIENSVHLAKEEGVLEELISMLTATYADLGKNGGTAEFELALDVLITIGRNLFNKYVDNTQLSFSLFKEKIARVNGYIQLLQMFNGVKQSTLREKLAIVIGRFHCDMELTANEQVIVPVITSGLSSCEMGEHVRIMNLMNAMISLAYCIDEDNTNITLLLNRRVISVIFRFLSHPQLAIIYQTGTVLLNLCCCKEKQSTLQMGVLEKVSAVVSTLSNNSFVLVPSPLDLVSTKNSTALSHSMAVERFCVALSNLGSESVAPVNSMTAALWNAARIAYAHSTLRLVRTASTDLENSSLRIIGYSYCALSCVQTISLDNLKQLKTVFEGFTAVFRERKNGKEEDLAFRRVSDFFRMPCAVEADAIGVAHAKGPRKYFAQTDIVGAMVGVVNVVSALPSAARSADVEDGINCLVLCISLLHSRARFDPARKYVNVLKRLKTMADEGDGDGWKNVVDANSVLLEALD